MNNHEIDITFLHTGEVHVQTFSKLLETHAANLNVKHIVNSQLLEDAMANGITDTLQTEVSTLLKNAAKMSKLVVCSCSTLGCIAENTVLENGDHALRIDRAMADLAVNSGVKILVLAALQSTVKPTAELMEASQKRQKTANAFDYCVVENSWQYFLNGQYEHYEQAIADIITQKQDGYDCIVLAQASMAGATKRVKEKRALILSSPEIGVKQLMTLLNN